MTLLLPFGKRKLTDAVRALAFGHSRYREESGETFPIRLSLLVHTFSIRLFVLFT